MKMRWVVLIAVSSLALGIGGATWFWQSFYAQFMNSGYVLRTESDIVTKVGVLESIRAGKIAEATTLLETQLDGDLIGAAALARGGTRFHPSTARAVALEARSRAISGYRSSNDEKRNAVQAALCLVPASAGDTSLAVVQAECSAGKEYVHP
jgi:hypothetical protein